MNDYQARLDELRARIAENRPNWSGMQSMFSDLREQMNRTAEKQKKVLSVTGTAWSDDRMVKAVVGPRGQLIELDIDPRVYRKPNSKALAATIVQTTRKAVEIATAKAQEILDEGVPSDMRLDKVGGMDFRKLSRSHDADLPKQLEDGDDGDVLPG